MTPANNRSELREILVSLKPHWKQAALFSVICNLLVLAPTVYMLQVYDRVVNSRSTTTLLMLTVLILAVYVMWEALEWSRNRILDAAGHALDGRLRERLFDLIFEANLRQVPGGTSQVFHDLRTLRDFLSGPTLLSLMDAPISALLLVIVFLVSPLLGWISVIAGLIQIFLTWLTEKNSQPQLVAANREAIAAQNYANSTLRNAQVIEAMGILKYIHRRWMAKQHNFLRLQAEASDHAGANASLSRMLQTVLSSTLLGLGAWLYLHGDLPPGSDMMLVGWILGPRALTPLVQVVASWRLVINARDAYHRLDRLLTTLPPRKAGMPLPPPRGLLTVDGVVASAPGTRAPIIRGVSFAVPAGQMLAIVGPSGSGKTTLARLMVGLWQTTVGTVRLDGVDVHSWNKLELGPHIGYLPQGIELFDGTLAENIARFGQVDQEKVEAAARAVGVHEAILALPEGYETAIGDDGCLLSGGQRQRIGLARAIYGNPRFLVLDEPNSSLDEAGQNALLSTLLALKEAGTTIVTITHRPNVLAAADWMLVLREGLVQMFGRRDEVLAAFAQAQQQAQAAQAQAQAQAQAAVSGAAPVPPSAAIP